MSIVSIPNERGLISQLTESDLIIQSVSEKVDPITKRMDSMYNDLATKFVPKSEKITPGSAVKVFFNADGLVVGSAPLSQSDIPELPINKITGLEAMLEALKTTAVSEPVPDTTYKVEPGSATKVNWNTEGRITSGSELLVSDIPTLPMSKIDGLSDFLKSLDRPSIVAKSYTIPAGTYVKFNVDSNGVFTGSKLTMDDIPVEISRSINEITANLSMCARTNVIDNIKQELSKKLDAKPTKPGTYFKVQVDSNGLVTGGTTNLSKSDLPSLTIDDILDLKRTISMLANTNEVADLKKQVTMMLNSVDKIGEITGLKNSIDNKADRYQVESIERTLDHLSKLGETLNNKIPNDTILAQLEKFEERISTLEGMISVLNHK